MTANITKLADLAQSEKDHATNNLMQWYVTEQVEEEANVDDIVSKLKMVGADGAGLFLIDRELKTRHGAGGGWRGLGAATSADGMQGSGHRGRSLRVYPASECLQRCAGTAAAPTARAPASAGRRGAPRRCRRSRRPRPTSSCGTAAAPGPRSGGSARRALDVAGHAGEPAPHRRQVAGDHFLHVAVAARRPHRTGAGRPGRDGPRRGRRRSSRPGPRDPGRRWPAGSWPERARRISGIRRPNRSATCATCCTAACGEPAARRHRGQQGVGVQDHAVGAHLGAREALVGQRLQAQRHRQRRQAVQQAGHPAEGVLRRRGSSSPRAPRRRRRSRAGVAATGCAVSGTRPR